MSAGIADAVGLIRAARAHDQAGLLAVVTSLDVYEARRMVSQLAHLVVTARSVAPNVDFDTWCSTLLNVLDDQSV